MRSISINFLTSSYVRQSILSLPFISVPCLSWGPCHTCSMNHICHSSWPCCFILFVRIASIFLSAKKLNICKPEVSVWALPSSFIHLVHKLIYNVLMRSLWYMRSIYITDFCPHYFNVRPLLIMSVTFNTLKTPTYNISCVGELKSEERSWDAPASRNIDIDFF